MTGAYVPGTVLVWIIFEIYQVEKVEASDQHTTREYERICEIGSLHGRDLKIHAQNE